MQIQQINGYIQSIYLAVYDDKIMLLDGCCRPDVDLIHDYITNALNRPISDLKTVIVTHMHPDHAGAANELKRRFDCQIVTGFAEREWYSGIDGALMYVSDVLLTQWVAKRMKQEKKSVWYRPKLQADHELNDGESIPGFEDWRVVETQGHTDRDISVFHMPSKTIYVADLVVKVKGKFIPPFPVFHPNRYRRSLQKVEQLRPNKVIVAHNGEVRISQDEYEQLLALAPDVPLTHWRATKSKLKKAFGRKTGSP